MFDKSCQQNQNTHFTLYIYFFKYRAVYEILWKKHCTDRQAADDNMAQAHCMLDT